MTVKQPFETVVCRHGPTVLRVCRAVVGSVDADDAWSETFLAALKAYPDLDPEANVEAWLVTIAHRKAIDITRYICTASKCFPVVGGALVFKDIHHLTSVFAESLGPYVEQQVTAAGLK